MSFHFVVKCLCFPQKLSLNPARHIQGLKWACLCFMAPFAISGLPSPYRGTRIIQTYFRGLVYFLLPNDCRNNVETSLSCFQSCQDCSVSSTKWKNLSTLGSNQNILYIFTVVFDENTRDIDSPEKNLWLCGTMQELRDK